MIIKVKGIELLSFFDLNIIGASLPIMSQFTIIGVLGFHLRIHQFYQGDGDDYHDHPRHFISLCLAGEYVEKLIGYPSRHVKPGTFTMRKATDAHNVTPLAFPCITIAVTSPVVRKWRKFKCE